MYAVFREMFDVMHGDKGEDKMMMMVGCGL